MSAVSVAPLPLWRQYDHDGIPLIGGKLFTYLPGGTTQVTVYKDYGQTVPWPNPIILDSDGLIHRPIYPPTNTLIRYVLQTADGVTLWDAPVVPPNVGSTVSTDVWLPFTPTWLNEGTPNKLLNGSLIGRYRYTGLTTIEYSLRLDFGSQTVSGSGNWTFGNLPGTMLSYAVPSLIHARGAAGYYGGIAIYQPAHTVVPFTGLNTFQRFTATAPFTWAAGDFLRIVGSFLTTPPPSPDVQFQGPTFLGVWGGPPTPD